MKEGHPLDPYHVFIFGWGLVACLHLTDQEKAGCGLVVYLETTLFPPVCLLNFHIEYVYF